MDPVRLLSSVPHCEPRPALLSCPICHHDGVFHGFNTIPDSRDANGRLQLGQRRCPNPDCSSHVFVIIDIVLDKVVASYPPATIPFDRESIPEKVAMALDEAISCHANGCWVASAIMIRKTLEEVCRDKQAQGTNLKERIKALGNSVILPPEFLEGMQDLRLLGNDAAHVESETYNDISEAEANTGIEVAKELLRAVYQYADLMKKLKALQRGDSPLELATT